MKMDATQTLWHRVLMQVIRDAAIPSFVKDGGQKLARNVARQWLDLPSEDFDVVCTFAGFNPEIVREWWHGIKDDNDRLLSVVRRLGDETSVNAFQNHRRE